MGPPQVTEGHWTCSQKGVEGVTGGRLKLSDDALQGLLEPPGLESSCFYPLSFRVLLDGDPPSEVGLQETDLEPAVELEGGEVGGFIPPTQDISPLA